MDKFWVEINKVAVIYWSGRILCVFSFLFCKASLVLFCYMHKFKIILSKKDLKEATKNWIRKLIGSSFMEST